MGKRLEPFVVRRKNMVYELENGKQSVRLDKLFNVLRVLNIECTFQSPLRESFLKEYPDADC